MNLWVASRGAGPSGVLAIGKRLSHAACTGAALVILAFAVL